MKSDRQTYTDQYSPSGGLARCVFNELPLARGDTGSESIALWQSTNVIPECCYQESYLERVIKIPSFAGMTNEHCLLAGCLAGSSPPLAKPPNGFSELDVGRPPGVEYDVGRTLDELVSSELETTRLTDGVECCQVFFIRLASSFGGPPTGFSESDVGEPPGVDCDIGRTLDELVSSELETTRLTEDEVKNGCCLTMDSRRFQTCPELVEGCRN